MSKHKRTTWRKAGSRRVKPLSRIRTVDTQSTITQLWTDRRAGARNIAGVRFQLLLTVHLLVEAACGRFSATALTPEGLEDIDTEPTATSHPWFVQAKERALGSPDLGLGDFADFLSHALPILRQDAQAHAALVTNASFTGGLVATGWGRSIRADLEHTDIATVGDVLEGITDNELEGLLERVSIISQPVNLTTLTHEITTRYKVEPAVAGFVLNRLITRVAQVADEQAGTAQSSPLSVSLTDLEGMVAEATTVIAAANLPASTLVRIIQPLTFVDRSPLPVGEFLRGVDVTPGHIAADLDVRRDAALEEIGKGLGTSAIALIVGPSGAGKSALLWRAAADLRTTMRTWRIVRLQEDDVPILLGMIRLHEPSEQFPCLLCADDLGRPSMVRMRSSAATVVIPPPPAAGCTARRHQRGRSLP
jgi:hypothetical protein